MLGMSRFRLRPLGLDDEPEVLVAQAELAVDGFGFVFFDEGTPWPEVVAACERQSRGEGLKPGGVPNTFLVGEVDGRIVGRVSVRHTLNDVLAEVGGHIGYGVRPAFRRRGYATALLRGGLDVARSVGLERVLVTCDDDNVGSATVIERCGGVFERMAVPAADSGEVVTVPKRRYWIDLR